MQLIYKKLYEFSDDAMLLLEDGRIIFCNPACTNMLRADSNISIPGLSPADFSPPNQPDGKDSLAEAERLLQDCLQSGISRFFWMHKRFDGEEFESEVTLKRIEIEGKPLVFAEIRDISDRYRAESAVRDAETKLSLIAENTEDLIWIRDLQFRYTYLSPSILTLKGFTIEEAMKLQPRDTVHPDDFRKAVKILKEELIKDKLPGVNKNRNRRFQMREYRKDGSTIWTEQSLSFIRDQNGNPTGFLGITRNITDQKQLIDELNTAKLQAQESDRLKSAFLANMSHEIRTPLNAILGFTEIILENDLEDDEKKQFSRIIKDSTAQLLNIITDIFDISKLETGQLNLLIKPCNLKKLLEEFTNYQIKVDPDLLKPITFQPEAIPVALDRNYQVDAERIRQVMNNLLNNAFKFSDSGTISYGANILPSGKLRVFVKDSGPGILKKNQKFIFQRFRQAHETLVRQFGGTGLGLAISKGLVELMGGKIGVISEEGKGAEFWFIIPLKEE